MSRATERTITSLSAAAEERDLTEREQRRLDQAIADQNAAAAHEAAVARWDRETS